MFTRDQILATYARTLADAKRLAGDVPDDRFAELPFTGAKHPAWVLSHLCVASGMAAAFLSNDATDHGGMSGIDPEIAAKSGPGSAPEADRALYVSKDVLLSELERVHGLADERLRAIDDAALAAEFPLEDYRAFWPTTGDAAVYMLGYHEGYHLGQLSQWRTAAGFAANNPF